MPKRRKEKRQHNDSLPEQRSRVVKSGLYDGSTTSKDFVVSGHSTGSANTEMVALSHQVSIDAGRVPDYSVDDGYVDTKARGFGATADVGDSNEIGSPDQYGDNPPLINSRSDFAVGFRTESSRSIPYGKIALWSSIGVAGAALGYLAYRYYSVPKPDFSYLLENPQGSKEGSDTQAKSKTRTKTKRSYQSETL